MMKNPQLEELKAHVEKNIKDRNELRKELASYGFYLTTEEMEFKVAGTDYSTSLEHKYTLGMSKLVD